VRRTFLLLPLIVVALGAALLFGPVGFGPGDQSAHATLLSEVKKLLASDAQAVDLFGVSVAVSGDTAVVGALFEDAAGSDAGAAYVFQRDQGGGDNWGQVKKLTASDAQFNDWFGVSVAVSGDIAVVGAWWEDTGGEDAGAAYVFGRDEGGAGNWGQVKKLTASDAQAGDVFGFSVAISGDNAVVGAAREDAGGSDAGAAYVFGRDQGGADNWGEVKKLIASDAQSDDLFGSVAVSGDTAVVGALSEDAGGTDAGAAYVFQRDEGGAGNWGQVKKLTASDAQADDVLGRSVAISGDTVIVGADWEDAGGINAGAAYVFGRGQGGADNWGEVKKLTTSDAQPTDEFGYGVAINGDTVVVGARMEDAGGSDAGAAYVFGRDQGGAGNWGEVKKFTASDAQADDSFGYSVALSGDTAVVGALGEDARGDSAGAAYVFQEPAPTPTPTPKPPDGDTDGDTIPNSDDPNDDNDGCTDVQEATSIPSLGGLRNPHSYWDFYDTPAGMPPTRDKMVNIIDIAAVILRFGTVSDPPLTKEEAFAQAFVPPEDLTSYHAAFDRDSPIPGEDLWDLQPPDGAINIIDIAATVVQFGHTCA
jgi:hypothetical protein